MLLFSTLLLLQLPLSSSTFRNLQTSRSTQDGPPVPDPDWRSIDISFEYLSDLPSSLPTSFFTLSKSWYSRVLKVLNQGSITITSQVCNDLEIPSKYQNKSISTHILILVTYSQSSQDKAWSSPCEVSEDHLYRPILGHIHLAGSFKSLTWEQKFALVTQQIASILAYDFQLVPYFMKGLTEHYGIDEVLGYRTVRNTQVTYMKTPSVIKYSKLAFQCLSLQGMDIEPLENEAAGESQGSMMASNIRWEKRLVFNDFMSAGFNKTYIVYSKISLALFEDSGWYLVDFEYGSDLTWGVQKGCGFFVNECVKNGVAGFSEFCNTTNAISLCDHTHTYKGTCSLAKQAKPIPAQYQYFTDPYLGGSDRYSDYCPTVLPSKTGSCLDIGEDSVSLNKDDYGETAGASSKCLIGTYVNQLSNKAVHLHAGCHKVTCEGNVAVIHVGGEVVFCEPNGGEVAVRGYDGYLFCPPSNILCRDLPCPFACSGQGKCISGKCNCFSGSDKYCRDFSLILSFPLLIILLN